MSLLRRLLLGVGDLITDAWGIQKVSFPYSLHHGTFTFNIPTHYFIYENGVQVYSSTNVISEGGAAKITADATVTNALLESRDCPRYQPNRGHLYSAAGWMPNKTAQAVREWGLGTAENGVFFRLKSDGLLYAVIVSGGVQRLEEVIDTSKLGNFNVENNNTYDIQFQWRSAGNYMFYIGNPETGASKRLKTVRYLGTLQRTSIEDPAMPTIARTIYGGESASMYLGCDDITAENGTKARTYYEAAFAENVAVAAGEPILCIHMPLQISGQTNTQTIDLDRLAVNFNKKGLIKVYSTRDPSAFSGGTFAKLDTNSYVQTDSSVVSTGAIKQNSVDLAKMRFFTAITVEANVRTPIEKAISSAAVVTMVRGDYLAIVATSSGTADAVLEWGEEL